MKNDNLSVLLVDDDPYVRDICELICQHNNIPLTTFNNAMNALEYLEGHTADVIIVDLFLPDVDGYRALKAIRQMPVGRSAKVIATTAYYTHDTGQEVIRRGFDGYLPKPFEAEELVPYLHQIAGSGSSA